jgi:hypothetical protein
MLLVTTQWWTKCSGSQVARVTGEGSSVTPSGDSVVSTRPLAELFGLGVLTLLLDASPLGVAAGSSCASGFLWSERCTDTFRQPFLCDLAVPELRSFVIDDDAKYRTEVSEKCLTLRI